MILLEQFTDLNLTTDQHKALEKLERFVAGNQNIFILKGYAGTGKTTLIKGLCEYLKETGKSFKVMAPTGRAAKVLRDKTNHGKTIHSSIYNLQDIKSINKGSEDVAEQSVKYYFPIKLDNHDERIIIVDEASMISNKESKQELFDFGTNVLLADLLTHAFSSNSKNKIIFVGDPAQLPPVGDSRSFALDTTFFENKDFKVDSVALTEVKRQEDNLILKNAITIREVLNQDQRTELNFNYDNESFIKLSSYEVISTYLDLFPNPEIGDGVIISYSNKQCYHYNKAIRAQLFPKQESIIPGDLILINNNNYHTYAVELFNGDIAKVINVSNSTVPQTAPVFIQKGGQQVRVNITLEFRQITIRVPNHDGDINCFIIDSLLNSIDRDLTPDMMKALYINFVMRFRDEQEKRLQQGLKGYKVGSEEFKAALKSDPFYNALKVKYGYAITCHKAQGGEWKQVIVDYSGRVGIYDEALRWCYTATTRGIDTVYTYNAPQINGLSKLKFPPISVIGKLPKQAISYHSIALSPFHNETQHKCKSLFYWQLLEQLDKSDFTIVSVESKGDFLERYTVKDLENKHFQLQASHKGSGHFVESFKILEPKGVEQELQLEDLFNSVGFKHITIEYTPSNQALEKLYSLIQSACNELDITITNVDEELDSYYVTYYLVTDAICSYIQFYFKKNLALSSAMPKTFNVNKDVKLQTLIEKLITYAS